MDRLSINIPYYFEQMYLPSKRHRKPRVREMVTTADIAMKKITDPAEFPVALVVKNYASLYEGARDYAEIQQRNDSKFVPVCDELRTYDGKLYKARRVSYGAAVSDIYEDGIDAARKELNCVVNCNRGYYGATELVNGAEPIAVSDNRNDIIRDLQQKADEYIIFDNKLWEECGEPMYVVKTFGLGHNHGGTGMFIDYYYNPNIGAKNYFNALHRQEAIDYANEVAKRRGDTNDIGRFGENKDIIVLDPKVVTRKPETDHGDGDPFLNGLEAMCEAADSVAEAGALVLMKTAMEIGGVA